MNSLVETYNSLESKYLKISQEYLEVSEEDMDDALQNHTALYAFFGGVLAHAKKVANTAEISFEYAEAEVKEERRDFLTSQGKKATEGALSAHALTISYLRDLKSKVLEAQHKYNLAKNIVTSLDHQKDMLVQMSANKRAEIKMVSDLG